ncbi:MAG: hypothetical protein QGH15_04155 [Kiritimatiellia bacterium]|nr:hypothetical protein [Kiritimatiellia bacterium]
MDAEAFEAIEVHAYNMSPADKRTARRIIFEHFDYIVDQWNEFHITLVFTIIFTLVSLHAD